MPQPTKTETPSSRRIPKAWLFVGIVILFVVLVRARLQSMPLERDEGEYAYAGQLMLQGIPPYQLAYNMKLPGTYAAYAAIMAVFGQTIEGIHIGLTIVNAACIVLMFLLGRKLFDSTVGLVAAATYGMVSLSPAVLGLAAHATHFVVLCALGALLCLLQAIQTRRRTLYFTSGCLFGLAFVMKQQGVLFGVFGGVWLVWLALKSRPRDWRQFAQQLGCYCAGCILPFAVVCLLLWHAGVFGTFWFWTFTYAQKYLAAVSVGEGLHLLRNELVRLAIPHWPLALLAGIGAFLLWWKRPARGHDLFVTAFFLFSAASVCPGLYFREHYFLLLLPAFSLCVGIAASFGSRLLTNEALPQLVHRAPMALVSLALVFAAGRQENTFFKQNPLELGRSIYGQNPFFESMEIGRYIREHTAGDARIMVFGSEPQIYFYAHRHSASGFIYMYDLMENQPFAVEMQKRLVEEVGAAKPDFFVVIKVGGSWAQDANSPTLMVTWAAQYCRENYDLVGAFDLVSRDETEYVWGADAANYNFRSKVQLLVFQRKPSA